MNERRSKSKLMDIGKIPPQAIELEEAVLGAVMLEGIIPVIATILIPDSFYVEANKIIYSAILSLFNESKPIDILTVTMKLKATGELEAVGGAYYITTLTNRVSSGSNAEFHARLVQQKFMQREVIRISSETISKAYEEDTDVFDLLEFSEREFYKISAGNTKQDLECTSALVGKAIKEIEVAGQSKDGVSGVPAGIHSVDKITGGWQKSDLIIVAARPAMGKTAFMLSVAANAALGFNKKVGIFSLEMSKMQLIKRLISSEAEINSQLLKSGKLQDYEWKQLTERCERLYKNNLFIDDTPGISVIELKSKARRFKERYGCEMIVIDYLQLMVGEKGSKGNREQEIAYISRSLKALAKDLDIPVIALSQLSRAVETRGGDKRPQLSDLRESGAIEQDADIVIFLHRPEYYGITEDSNGASTFRFGEAIIAKHRNGACDSAQMKYISQYTKFVDWFEPVQRGLNPNMTFESDKEETVFT
jgi:replicative DNA helicase